MNSDVPQFVTDNFVQAHISDNDNNPESVVKDFAMVFAVNLGAPGDTRRSTTSLVQSSGANNGRDHGCGSRGGKGPVLGAVVTKEQPQAEHTGAIDVAVADISLEADSCGKEEDAEVNLVL